LVGEDEYRIKKITLTKGCLWHRVHAICSRYVDLAVAQADLSVVNAVAMKSFIVI
jgi:hypothetical protein